MSDSKPFKPGYIEDRIIKDSINVNHDDRITFQKVRLLNQENEYAGNFISSNFISSEINKSLIKNSFFDNCSFNTLCGYVNLSSTYENVKCISSDINNLSIWTSVKTNDLQQQITDISIDLSTLNSDLNELSIYSHEKIENINNRTNTISVDLESLSVDLYSLSGNFENLSSYAYEKIDNLDGRVTVNEQNIENLKQIISRGVVYKGQLSVSEQLSYDNTFSCLFILNKDSLNLEDILSVGYLFSIKTEPIRVENVRIDSGDFMLINESVGISSVNKEYIDVIDGFNYDLLSSLSSDIMYTIDNRHYSSIYIKDENEGYSNLSVQKIPIEDYFKLIIEKKEISNCIYIVSSDYYECYGHVLSNAIMTDDGTESEVATKHYVDHSLSRYGYKILEDNDLSIRLNSINKSPTLSHEQQLSLYLPKLLSGQVQEFQLITDLTNISSQLSAPRIEIVPYENQSLTYMFVDGNSEMTSGKKFISIYQAFNISGDTFDVITTTREMTDE